MQSNLKYIFTFVFLLAMVGSVFANAPTITITNPNTNPAHSKTITASVNDPDHHSLFLSVNNSGSTICNNTTNNYNTTSTSRRAY